MICTAIRADGSSCRAQAMTGSTSCLCFWHDPGSREKMLEASRKGGARRAVELPEAELLTPEKARAILAGCVEAVVNGSLDSTTARTVGFLLQVESSIRQGSELEARVGALESAAQERSMV